jgi:hypothetical protein
LVDLLSFRTYYLFMLWSNCKYFELLLEMLNTEIVYFNSKEEWCFKKKTLRPLYSFLVCSTSSKEATAP